MDIDRFPMFVQRQDDGSVPTKKQPFRLRKPASSAASND
jgi:hypothetical protein